MHAVEINALSKSFRIDLARREPRAYNTLRDSVSDSLHSLFSRSPVIRTSAETFWALRNINLWIERGSVVGLIGSNGAGKSTLLKILSRITPPTRGSIHCRGTVATLLEVGTGFHHELSGRENIFLYGAILGMSRAEIGSRFDEIVEFSEVEAFLDTPVKRYSSGMYMRLAFAVAAHLRSDILLVDEVLAVGDARFQSKCLGKMRDVTHGEGRTVIFVSHNMQAVQGLCTQAAYLEKGRLIEVGEVRSIIRLYTSRNSANQSCREWGPDDGPGNEELRLVSVGVRSAPGCEGAHSSADAIEVEIGFQTRKPLEGLCVGFDLITAEGATVFRSFQTDLPASEWPTIVTGFNRWACIIPGGWLNSGVYFVCPRIGVHNLYWIVNSDAVICFEVLLAHGVSPLWNSLKGKARPGAVAPILRWTDRPAIPQVRM